MRFLPKTTDFFAFFFQIAKNIEKTGKLVRKINLRGEKELLSLSKEARRLELETDGICHQIYKEAATVFITPIDREDICRFASTLDNVIDLIENLISILIIYRVKYQEEVFPKFLKLIWQGADETGKLVELLAFREKKRQEFEKLVARINLLENKADKFVWQGIDMLFKNHNDPIEIIKWKDIYQNMEEILDQYEEISYLAEEIVIKNF